MNHFMAMLMGLSVILYSAYLWHIVIFLPTSFSMKLYTLILSFFIFASVITVASDKSKGEERLLQSWESFKNSQETAYFQKFNAAKRCWHSMLVAGGVKDPSRSGLQHKSFSEVQKDFNSTPWPVTAQGGLGCLVMAGVRVTLNNIAYRARPKNGMLAKLCVSTMLMRLVHDEYKLMSLNKEIKRVTNLLPEEVFHLRHEKKVKTAENSVLSRDSQRSAESDKSLQKEFAGVWANELSKEESVRRRQYCLAQEEISSLTNEIADKRIDPLDDQGGQVYIDDEEK